MGFSSKQVQALRRQPSLAHIRTREANGRELTYLEGWYAISEANRIFGFDGWSRETVESRCVLARENRGTFLAVYLARVRVTVHADGTTIVREGHGTGEGRGTSPGEVHDIALKAAETDATKRALATFGKPFGLELYRGGRRKPHRDPHPHRPFRCRRTPALDSTRTTRPRSHGRQATTADGKARPRPSTSEEEQAHMPIDRRRRLLRRWHQPQPTSYLHESTKASSRSPNPSGCATRHT